MREESVSLKKYGSVKVLEISAPLPSDWDFDRANIVRVELPASPDFEAEMISRGFRFADRTMGVSIDASRCPLDLEKIVRMDVSLSDGCKNEILEIAKESFPHDSRFNLSTLPNPSLRDDILAAWVAELEPPLVAFFKGSPVGFLALKQTSAKSLFVHLAAVGPQYRLTGAAMSLYAKAVLVARERGCSVLEGRISTLNCAVMNLYAYFGAKFLEPYDVFLKEIENAP